MKKGAQFSACRLYRYTLWRVWDENAPYLAVIGLNPSTATEELDDPTIRRCMDYAKQWGFGGLYMLNLFAFRATDPNDMKAVIEPIGEDNNKHIVKVASNAGLVLAAWGNHGKYRNRDDEVISILSYSMCLKITATDCPAHPLYQRKDALPFLYSADENHPLKGFNASLHQRIELAKKIESALNNK